MKITEVAKFVKLTMFCLLYLLLLLGLLLGLLYFATLLKWHSAWVFSFKFTVYFQNTFSQEQVWRVASVSWLLSLPKGILCTIRIFLYFVLITSFLKLLFKRPFATEKLLRNNIFTGLMWYRNSRPDVFLKKGVLKICRKFR